MNNMNNMPEEDKEEERRQKRGVAKDVADGGNGNEDADSSSGSEPPSSSSQETSGAGYTGDYSSISDSSENGGSQGKPEGVRDGEKASASILKNRNAPSRARHSQKRHNKRVVDGGTSLPDEELTDDQHIHQHHHQRNKHGHHHYQKRGSNASSLYDQEPNSDEDDVNRKINEIMNLYKVSLQAQRDINNAARAHLKLNAEVAKHSAALTDQPLQVIGDPQSKNVLPKASSSTKTPAQGEEAKDGNEGQLDSSECYANLVEACRPFFNDSRALMTGEQPPMTQTNVGSDEAHSSSGFTSFFTTTNQSGNSNNTNSGGSSNDSSNQKKAKPQQEEVAQEASPQPEKDIEANDTSSETSSLVVQARVKRKYKEQQTRRTSSSNSDNTNNAQKKSNEGIVDAPVSSKRVRIETVALDAAKSKEKARSKVQRTESSSLTSSLSASTETNSAAKKPKEEGKANQNQDTDTSAKPRVVTDSSGTTTANNSSGSGTGSGNDNNTTSKSDSGGDGTSDQQKLTGDRDSTADSETGAGESQSQEEVKQKAGSTPSPTKSNKPLIHHHHTRNEKKPHDAPMKDVDDSATAAAVAATASARQDEADALVSKEKRQEKKRKRMVSRREYEEELRQMRDSSESNSDAALEPGKPVTLEEVLSLTKTARLLVQALPPFLAVHTNAAFTNLCGIQSSTIIGRPVATIISLPSNKEGESSGSDNTNSREESDKMSSLSGSADGNGRNRSSMAMAGEGDAAAAAGQNTQNPPSPSSGFRIDRLIVARGYGHIHNVELECHSTPHTPHAHAIEGSEVKFIEGNKSSKRRKKSKPKLLCRMSVSPVVSTSVRAVSERTPADGQRKHKHPPELQSVKHYLIQLEAVDGPRLLVSGSSSSFGTDSTLEAQLLGITKAEFQARRCRVESRPDQSAVNQQVMNNPEQMDQRETEDSQDDNSNTSSAMELVATCG